MKKIIKTETGRLDILLAILIIIAIAAAVLLNMLMSSLSDRYPLSADLTASKGYDIGDDTKEILDSLTDDIDIYVLSTRNSFGSDKYLTQMRTMIEKYANYSQHIRLEYIDYTTDPAFAAQYPGLALSAGDVLVSGPEAVKQLPLANMFTYTYDSEGALVISGSRVEEAVSSAIVSSVTDNPVNIGILTGNAVYEDRTILASVLTDNNYEVSEVNMVTGSFEGLDVLILLAPQQDLSEDVLSRFDDFLYNEGNYGKTLLYAASAEQPELPNINVFLREWGIEVGDGAVFETDENFAYGYQPYYPFAEYTDETFRDLLRDSSRLVLMPVSRPLQTIFDYKNSKIVTTLLSFSASSGVRPSGAGSNFTVDQAVVRGPIPAAVMSTLMVSGSEYYSNVIVSASAYAFGSSMMSNTSIANTEYWTQLLGRITDRGDAVSISPKSLAGNILTITTGAAKTWGIILCIVIPLMILFTGIFIYLKRRYK